MRFARFIDGPHGRLFCLGHEGNAVAPHGTVLLLPPFGEEMNKSRHVLAGLVRALAAAGRDVVLPDLSGTGDSAGDFGDATIDRWRADLDAVCAAFAGGQDVDVMGLRFGGLLAADLSQRHRVGRLCLLHPVVDGRQQLTQLLRMRLAAGISSGRKESMAEFKNAFERGESIEAAGYRVNADMAAQLQALRLDEMPLQGVEGLAWIEVAADPERPLLPVSQRLVDSWREQREVETAIVGCDAFWTTQEIARCDALIDRASRWINGEALDADR
jgi:exosortase A-associated hydrolase 2